MGVHSIHAHVAPPPSAVDFLIGNISDVGDPYPPPCTPTRNLKGLHNSSPGLGCFGFPITGFPDHRDHPI